MRRFVILLASASLFACNQNSNDAAGKTEIDPTPASLSYDGADYTDDSAKLAHGERLSFVLGCQGCHGENLQGTNVTGDDEGFGDVYASNLSLVLADYSDAELERALREGVPKDGRKMMLMPSEMFANLSDKDLAAVMAYVRTFPPGGEPAPPHKPGPVMNAMIEAGQLEDAAATVKTFNGRLPYDAGAAHAKGRYIASTACTECHNGELEGYEDFSPDLSIAGSFSDEQFAKLMREGVGLSKPELNLMSGVARHRFSHLTDAELAALHGYLKARAEQLPAD